MSRIKLTDTTRDMIIKMAEGNPGALTFLMEALNEDQMNMMNIILSADVLEIYGSKLYMLWNDACNREVSKVRDVFDAWITGALSKERIHENLNQGRAKPFEELNKNDE